MQGAAVRVLVLDDDPQWAAFAAMACRGAWQADTAVAHSADEALRTLAHDPVDLVITDLSMPDMDGLTLIERVRAGWPDVPVVAVTGLAVGALREDVDRAGARRLWSKVDLATTWPTSPGELLGEGPPPAA